MQAILTTLAPTNYFLFSIPIELDLASSVVARLRGPTHEILGKERAEHAGEGLSVLEVCSPVDGLFS